MEPDVSHTTTTSGWGRRRAGSTTSGVAPARHDGRR